MQVAKAEGAEVTGVCSEAGGRWLGGNDRQLRAMMPSPFVSQKLGAFVSPEKREDLPALLELVESGRMAPVIDPSFPLVETAAAIEHMQNGSVRGKVVIKVA